MTTTVRRRPPTYEEQLNLAIRRIKAVKTRSTTVLAREFFANDDPALGQDLKEEWRTLPRRLNRLYDHLRNVSEHVDDDLLPLRLNADPIESRRLALTAAVFKAAPPTFSSSFRDLFAAILASRQARWERSQEAHAASVDESASQDEIMHESYGGGEEEGGEGSQSHTGNGYGGDDLGFDESTLYDALRSLGWLKTKLARPLGEALHDTVLSAVRDKIGGDFEDDSAFDAVLAWKAAIVQPFVSDLVGPDAFDADDWDKKLDHTAWECFCDVRISEVFDLIAEYPDSLPAVSELRGALDRTRMHAALAAELRSSLRRRLIHPGANTSQIIDVYINTIKVLREIDPSDELLEAVAGPVRSYLRGRGDTVRCILLALLTDEEAGGDLYEELRRNDAKPLEEAQLDSDDEEEPPDFDWQPKPSLLKRRGTITGKVSSRSSGRGDILSMLVSIYGSKELFVSEYRVMLADKLLANLDYDTDKEVHNLELLKLRFGEVSMRQCEVMIKDIDDSKRIIANIRSTLKNKAESKGSKDGKVSPDTGDDAEPVVDAAIVSHIFWPALQKEQLKNHPRIQAQLDQFSIEYAKLKNPRRLIWMGQLGTVELQLEVVEDGPDGVPHAHVKDFTCSPLHATLVSHFEDKEQWTASELSNETGVPEDIVRKKMGFWINNRVIRVIRSGGFGEIMYELASVDDLTESEHHGTDHHEEEGEGQAVSVGAQEASEMEIYESYIVGMLSNLGQLPLERIHNMLKMFVTGSDHKYDKTPQQLSAFLQQLCRDDKLECGVDGMYKLMKK